jgi:hypothetical protein
VAGPESIRGPNLQHACRRANHIITAHPSLATSHPNINFINVFFDKFDQKYDRTTLLVPESLFKNFQHSIRKMAQKVLGTTHKRLSLLLKG